LPKLLSEIKVGVFDGTPRKDNGWHWHQRDIIKESLHLPSAVW